MRRLRDCLAAARSSDCLMMTHASTTEQGIEAFDGYLSGRLIELQALLSERFGQALRELAFAIGPGV